MSNIKPMSLLDRYLCTQLLWVALFTVVLFSIIWLAPDKLFKLTQYVFAGDATVGQAVMMFVYHLPEVLQQTIPIAVLLASIFLFQRLSQSYELIALLASGISPKRILTSILWVGLLFGALHVVVQEQILPHTAEKLERLYTSLALKDVQDRNFLFVEKNHQNQLSKFFMIGQIQKPQLTDFVVLYYSETPQKSVQISRILRAKTGRWLPKVRQWQLLNGIEYVLNDEGVYKDIRQFAEQQVRTDRYAKVLLDYTRLNPMVMPWWQLKRHTELLREGGQLQDVPFFEVRLWQKWAGPAATAVFAVLGALLGMERIRTNRTYGLLFGAVIIFIYSILVPFSNNLSTLGFFTPWMIAWFPLFVTILVAAVLQFLRPQQG